MNTKLLNVSSSLPLSLSLDQSSSAVFLARGRTLEDISIISLSLPLSAPREDLFSYFLQRARSTVNKTVRSGLGIFDPGRVEFVAK